MKERPILFSDQMVRAILEGRKTVTRRIAKPVKHPDLGNIYAPGALVLEHEPQHVFDRACPYGQPGDRLWVREAWQGPLISDEEQAANQSWWKDMTKFQDQAHCAYRASGDNNEYVDPDGYFHCKWKPSIHMPRWASRILLEITAVRVERLHQITIGEICKEGLARSMYEFIPVTTAFDAFAELWNSTGGDWDANPWVWVIEFRRVTP
ncbi:TPA: hypothetical protein P6M77_001506 [Pseudomonas aeruginosa]|uniref:hypothetical protein n=1 Tax=Pseudomonas aeruginosa TaxID=287 RepID=UPI00071B028A|nr:hypothetical protein [Pseudomonas aeruginosa]AYW60740.1 hypothetical protein EGV93_17855 [Pseudomonas aeruginosa]KSP34855.1 hypothetical protein APB15_29880 [Pseudomonas aeruginosa]UOC61075.1 hypothetical protein IPV49_17385 [Pseudomonas aeruginosa]UOC67160.1 hypothetical protein IPV48_17360 [Pseudomonas aeruginosa]UOC73244.1 hypothetical protein IPV46_17385 [Pseudomonas aeruginosa]